MPNRRGERPIPVRLFQKHDARVAYTLYDVGNSGRSRAANYVDASRGRERAGAVMTTETKQGSDAYEKLLAYGRDRGCQPDASTHHETCGGTEPCGTGAGDDSANNEPLPDKWPTDADDNQRTNTFDLVPYIPALNSVAPGPPYKARLDLNASGDINTFDVVPFISLLNKVCTP